LGVTLYEILVAFLLTVALGLAVGFAIGLFRFVSEAYEPLVYLAYAFPGVAIYPIIVILSGFGSSSKIVFAVFIGFFPMVLSVISALRSIKPSLVTVATAFGASRLQLFRKVVLPGAAPAIFGGIRLAMGLNIVGVLFAEMVGSAAGVGWLIITATYELESPSQYAAVLVAIIVGIAIAAALRFIEARVSYYE
jgi:NitT/TauT family transport system permease protein